MLDIIYFRILSENNSGIATTFKISIVVVSSKEKTNFIIPQFTNIHQDSFSLRSFNVQIVFQTNLRS
jgi:hypothetical protein